MPNPARSLSSPAAMASFSIWEFLRIVYVLVLVFVFFNSYKLARRLAFYSTILGNLLSFNKGNFVK